MATRQLAPLLIKPPSRLATLPPSYPPPCFLRLVIVLNLAPNVHPSLLGWNPRAKKKKKERKKPQVVKGDGFTGFADIYNLVKKKGYILTSLKWIISPSLLANSCSRDRGRRFFFSFFFLVRILGRVFDPNSVTQDREIIIREKGNVWKHSVYSV